MSLCTNNIVRFQPIALGSIWTNSISIDSIVELPIQKHGSEYPTLELASSQ